MKLIIAEKPSVARRITSGEQRRGEGEICLLLRQLQPSINKQLKDMQRQISSVLFKGEKLTPEQLAKFMEVSKQIRAKIDILNVETATQAIGLTCEESSETDKTTSTSALQASGNMI